MHLSKTAFKEAIRRGLGRAILHLDMTPDKEVLRKTVLWACLNNTCFDAQSEDNRAWYLYTAILKFNDPHFFEEKIIEKYKSRMRDSWLFDQLSGLLQLFAADGSEKARETLEQKYTDLFSFLSKKRVFTEYIPEREQFDWLCVHLIELDGFSTFKRIAKDVGGYWAKGKRIDAFLLDRTFSAANKMFGRKRVEKLLQIPASHTDFSPPPPSTLEELTASSRENTKQYIGASRRFLMNASKEELDQLAQAVMDETDLAIKTRLLYPFSVVPFAPGADVLWEYADSGHAGLRNAALNALQLVKSPRTRLEAIKMLEDDKTIYDGLVLLSQNYKKEDKPLLIAAMKKALGKKDIDFLHHHSFYVLMEAMERNRRLPDEILTMLYEKNPCSYCREYTVELMQKRGMLTPELIAECRYDSNQEIREIAKKLSPQE